MDNEVTPLLDAFNKVRDFIVNPPCEGCKRRKAKLQKYGKAVGKAARDLLRRRGG